MKIRTLGLIALVPMLVHCTDGKDPATDDTTETEDTVDTEVDTVDTEVDTVDTEVDTVDTEVDTVDTEVDTVDTEVDTEVGDTDDTDDTDVLPDTGDSAMPPANTGTLIISEIADPDAGVGRYVELYNPGPGSVDLTGYSLQRYPNGNTIPESAALPSQFLAEGETFVVVSNATDFQAMWGVTEDLVDGQVANGNGDDVYALDLNGNVVDVFGEIGVDGSGTAWEYADAYVIRDGAIIAPNAVFVIGEWWFTDDMAYGTPGSHPSAAPPVDTSDTDTALDSADTDTADSFWTESFVPWESTPPPDTWETDLPEDTGDTGGLSFSYITDVEPILVTACGSCHISSSLGGLNFAAGSSALVGVPSVQVPSMPLIDPGEKSNSYFWHKINGTHTDPAVNGSGQAMPLGMLPLSFDELLFIQGWIDLGAAP